MTEIHLLTILLTILIAVLVFMDHRRAELGQAVRHLDRTAICGTAVGYVSLVSTLIFWAAFRG